LRTKKVALLAVMLSLTLIIGIVEKNIPFDSFVPGVKPGLSNAVILIAVYIFDFPSSFLLVVLKCVTLALVTGNASSFIYSLSGSLLSFFVMWITVFLTKNNKNVSPVGISVLGAVFHNFGQISAAAFMLGTVNVVYYLPVLVIFGVITGVIVGLTVKYSIAHIKKLFYM